MFTTEQLVELLKVARRDNAERGITGLLLYQDGQFLKVLEGNEADVLHVFERIKRDTRHKDLVLISQQPVDEREFGEWEMGFVNPVELDTEAVAGYSDFLKDVTLKDKPSVARTALHTFRTINQRG